jgi:glycosyltransferase involved in cell wall biosynthesis
MKEIKEVIVFSEQGDPRAIKTWSNVPYFLVSSLEEKGIKVNTVNLQVQDTFQKVARKIWDNVFTKIVKNTFYGYSRSFLYEYISSKKIAAAVKLYPNADLLIFTTFSMSASKLSSKPSILFCDWTIDHYITYFLEKTPNYFERSAIKKQNEVIENADNVYVLFPSIAQKMQKDFKNPNIFYIGNVVNNLVPSDQSIIEKKLSGNDILFVGSKKYIQGALNLIDSYKELQSKYAGLQLHLIGINQEDLPVQTEGVNCYGYLDKAKKEDCDKYYDLLGRSKIFINTTPKWASFSASLEAMYFYTPLIIPAYQEFVQTFGKDINFGSYYNAGKDNLTNTINKVLTADNYKELCLNANTAVKDFTWKNFTDAMLGNISATLLNK